ncbi:MAG: type II secretion system protein [Bdellovibrionales bacterium]|nr:type II secretion system protein [Bdellovibrionales bacterium]
MKSRFFRNSKGFTLLEVLVAIGILVGAILVVSNTWSGNFIRVRKSNLYNNAAVLLEQKIVEIRAQYQGKALEEIKESDAGDFGSEHPGYRWTFASQKFQMPDLTSVFVNQGMGDASFLTMIKQVQEFINQSVKEGTVSVFVKAGKKEVEFSVTTYFVDYNKQFGAGGGTGGG